MDKGNTEKECCKNLTHQAKISQCIKKNYGAHQKTHRCYTKTIIKLAVTREERQSQSNGIEDQYRCTHHRPRPILMQQYAYRKVAILRTY